MSSSEDSDWEPDVDDVEHPSDYELDFEFGEHLSDVEVNTPASLNPPSLKHISKFHISELIYTACVRIEKEHGKYSSKECAKKVDELCKYLMSEVGHLLEEVWEEVMLVDARKHVIKDHNILINALNQKNGRKIPRCCCMEVE